MISSLIQIDFKDEFLKINNKYCLLLKIAGIDIFNYSDEDRDSACKNFALATASLQGVEHKYIITDSKPILSENKKYVLAKSEMTDNAFHKYLLNRQYELFDYFEESHYDRLAFLMIFSDNADELNQSAVNFMKRMRYVDISICDEKEKQEFLSKQLRFTETVDDVYAKSTEFGISYIKLDDMIALTSCKRVSQTLRYQN